MMMKKIQTEEIELSYEDEGDGQPVVFVHGSLSDFCNWDQHRGMITAQFRMIAPTERYFGVSPWPDDGRNFWIQTSMAVRHPELVDRLFLYESSQSTFVDESDAFSRATNERLGVIQAGKAAADRGDSVAAVEISHGWRQR